MSALLGAANCGARTLERVGSMAIGITNHATQMIPMHNARSFLTKTTRIESIAKKSMIKMKIVQNPTTTENGIPVLPSISPIDINHWTIGMMTATNAVLIKRCLIEN